MILEDKLMASKNIDINRENLRKSNTTPWKFYYVSNQQRCYHRRQFKTYLLQIGVVEASRIIGENRFDGNDALSARNVEKRDMDELIV